MKYCLQCSKLISRNAKRCRTCANTGDRNPHYKEGFYSKDIYCSVCNKQLSKSIGTEKNKLCRSCSTKKQYENPSNHHWFGVRKIGKNSPNYKDGRTKLVDAIRRNTDYYKWRTACFNRDNYTCQMCNVKGGYLEVDHIKQLSIIISEFLAKYSQFSTIEDKETLLRLAQTYVEFWDLSNGRTLCKECHKLKTKKDRVKN